LDQRTRFEPAGELSRWGDFTCKLNRLGRCKRLIVDSETRKREEMDIGVKHRAIAVKTQQSPGSHSRDGFIKSRAAVDQAQDTAIDA
jgi:hypothetical protein